MGGGEADHRGQRDVPAGMRGVFGILVRLSYPTNPTVMMSSPVRRVFNSPAGEPNGDQRGGSFFEYPIGRGRLEEGTTSRNVSASQVPEQRPKRQVDDVGRKTKRRKEEERDYVDQKRLFKTQEAV